MKAITVKQPWAWAIIHGGKDIENRTAVWAYRGPLLIHAALTGSDRGDSDQRIIEALTRDHWRPQIPAVTGAVIGVVDLVDVHPDTGCCRPWGEGSYQERTGRWRRLITHLVMENPRPVAEPIPVRGALGLWNFPDDLVPVELLR